MRTICSRITADLDAIDNRKKNQDMGAVVPWTISNDNDENNLRNPVDQSIKYLPMDALQKRFDPAIRRGDNGPSAAWY